jgi:hypothetical protein
MNEKERDNEEDRALAPWTEFLASIPPCQLRRASGMLEPQDDWYHLLILSIPETIRLVLAELSERIMEALKDHKELNQVVSKLLRIQSGAAQSKAGASGAKQKSATTSGSAPASAAGSSLAPS